jgi:hypothetical protein
MARIGLLAVEHERLTFRSATVSLFALFALITATRAYDDDHDLAVIAALWRV